MAKSGISLAIDEDLDEIVLTLDPAAYKEFRAICAGLKACISTLEHYGIQPERLYSAAARVAVVAEFVEKFGRYVVTSVVELEPPPSGDGVRAPRPRTPKAVRERGEDRAIIFRPGRRGSTSVIHNLRPTERETRTTERLFTDALQRRLESVTDGAPNARGMSPVVLSRIGARAHSEITERSHASVFAPMQTVERSYCGESRSQHSRLEFHAIDRRPQRCTPFPVAERLDPIAFNSRAVLSPNVRTHWISRGDSSESASRSALPALSDLEHT